MAAYSIVVDHDGHFAVESRSAEGAVQIANGCVTAA